MILYADDNEDWISIVQGVCSDLGIQADVAHNGMEAVDKAASTLYSLIFMDLHMPILDGVNAAMQIRRLPKPFNAGRIYALTGDLSDETRALCLRHGFDYVLGKPFRLKQFEDIVQSHGKGTAP